LLPFILADFALWSPPLKSDGIWPPTIWP